jgi:pilus assembly protein TadC
MEKFFYNVSLLIFGGFSLMCLLLLFNTPFEWKNLFITIFFLFFTFVFAFLSDEAELRENNTPKEDEPKVDEIISVTEIKGVKKIIKNGKVIYCEELKADELKVFENLKDKN